MGTGCVWKNRSAYELSVSSVDDSGGSALPKPSTPKSPTVAELKGRLVELGLEIPANVVEKSELIAIVNQGEQQCTQSSEFPCSPYSAMLDQRSPASPSTPKRSVAELKKRLRELGFKVPTSIVEKSELLELVQEAEKQVASINAHSPTAPKTSTATFKLRTRLKDLGVDVPDVHMEEDDLLKLLRQSEQQTAPVKVETVVGADVTVTCTRGIQGVARIDLTSAQTMRTAQDDSNNPTEVSHVQGALLHWVRGECIGHGASGTVYRALNQTSGQLMAVKEVHMDLQRKTDARFKEALENEIALMRDLRHPNIVAYYGCDWIGSSIFMYLEYMAGGSMARVLDQFGAFEESLIADYARQLLNGLEYLHTQNPYVVHRDIKGANVLLGVDATVKLADFGCSKREKETRSLTIGGSIPWMAPEVIAHARYGRAGDIWSFGCLMIEMATAEPPWGEFDNLMAAMIKIGMSKEMPYMPEASSTIYRAFVRRCLNRDPGRRLSATELLNERFVRVIAAGGDDVAEPLLECVDELLAEDEMGQNQHGKGTREGSASGGKVAPSRTEEDRLPKGWEKHYDPGYREWYYWHRPTGRSVWERPIINEDDEDEQDEDDGEDGREFCSE
mmetsp:Transcript_70539/g.178546  ORF Transcript_70539/g.178546 Transcript_70539/m.178546 type:complete len:617 (+) Transcript_70539:63-1913(+)